MNKLMTAVALAIALPGVAHAQAKRAECLNRCGADNGRVRSDSGPYRGIGGDRLGARFHLAEHGLKRSPNLLKGLRAGALGRFLIACDRRTPPPLGAEREQKQGEQDGDASGEGGAAPGTRGPVSHGQAGRSANKLRVHTGSPSSPPPPRTRRIRAGG